ncbi:hypothetical protein LRR18_18640, partial [Mangrovimonas sp. AS39]|uniref:hypothetical protein n=1 Tax=Mangrovimonas futianensis TaxID=2895523 RepID=UPI001E32250F
REKQIVVARGLEFAHVVNAVFVGGLVSGPRNRSVGVEESREGGAGIYYGETEAVKDDDVVLHGLKANMVVCGVYGVLPGVGGGLQDFDLATED